MKKLTRNYRMTKRAEQVNVNEQNIVDATVSLWKKHSMHEITLEMVAELSGISVRTILRKYGSKEGLIEYCIENDKANIGKNRNAAFNSDIQEALSILLKSYEEIGDAAIRTLAIEDEMEVAKKALNHGRAYHKDWCEQIFADFLPEKQAEDYETRLCAFFAATDFYIWKLMRKDLGKSKKETYSVLWTLVESLTKHKP